MVNGGETEVDVVVELVIVAQRGGVMVCRSSCRGLGEKFSRRCHIGSRDRTCRKACIVAREHFNCVHDPSTVTLLPCLEE